MPNGQCFMASYFAMATLQNGTSSLAHSTNDPTYQRSFTNGVVPLCAFQHKHCESYGCVSLIPFDFLL